MVSAMTRRMFTKLSATAAGGFLGSAQSSAPAGSDALQIEFLLDMVLDPLPPNNIGSVGVNRVVVPVAGGVFDGPQIKATVVGPSGDWTYSKRPRTDCRLRMPLAICFGLIPTTIAAPTAPIQL